jgi:hypothetical protein
MHRATGVLTPGVLGIVLLCAPSVTDATVTAQFWAELGGSASGNGLTQAPGGIDSFLVTTDRTWTSSRRPTPSG